jgi:hypothetical protein
MSYFLRENQYEATMDIVIEAERKAWKGPSFVWGCRPHDRWALWQMLLHHMGRSKLSCRMRSRPWLSADRGHTHQDDMRPGMHDSRSVAFCCKPVKSTTVVVSHLLEG